MQTTSRARWHVPKDTSLALALLFPVLFIMGLVILYPLVRGVYLSLLHYKLIDPAGPSFAGAVNYSHVLHDQVLREAFLNTLLFSGSSVVGGFVLGLALALLLDANIKFPRFFRGVAMTPWVVPYIVVAFLFLFMFNFDVGIVNHTLRSLGIVSKNLAWLANPKLAMGAVVTANVWNQTPFYMLMLLAGLQSIPTEIKEAAIIDGANGLQLFRSITVPHLQNIMVITTMLMLIRNFNSFPLIWTMTQGGPVYSTTTLAIYIYRLAFSDFDIGYAATVGIIWLLVLLAFTALYLRRFEREIAL
jgi:multiple sugar transport system permease protein